jgi:two-component system, NtrC family, nitrogen regulation sensor histidine kinase NtrY
MADKEQNPKRRQVPWVLGIVVFTLLVVAVMLQSSNLWKSFSAETASDTLLLYALSSLNFAAFVVFGFIFLRSILKLARERRTFQLGSRIKTKLLLYFFAVSLMPIFAMAIFSYLYMNRALERWFTNIPENVIKEAREVQRQSLVDRSATLDESSRMIAAVIEKGEPTQGDLAKIATAGSLTQIEVLSSDGRTLVSYQRDILPEQRNELDGILNAVRAGNFSDPTLHDGKGFDVSVVEMSGGRKLAIVPDPFGERAVSQIVENSLLEFERLKQKQVTVRQVGFLTLGMLTFLLIFGSSWIAFHIARGLTAPIKALAEGADEIARGNYGFRVEVLADDELALLVGAFNHMSNRLEASAKELGERQRYIETVIETLPNGVISFDGNDRIGTINRAAVNILKLEDADFSGLELETLVQEDNRAALERLVLRAKRVGHASEQTVLKRENANGGRDNGSGLTGRKGRRTRDRGPVGTYRRTAGVGLAGSSPADGPRD